MHFVDTKMLTKNSNLFKHFGFVEMLRNKYRFLIRLFLTQILIQTYLTNEIFNFSNENFVRIFVQSIYSNQIRNQGFWDQIWTIEKQNAPDTLGIYQESGILETWTPSASGRDQNLRWDRKF